MTPEIKDLGKVCITPRGIWNRDKTYERLDLVYCKQTNTSYIAKEDVPKGQDVINEKYWQLVNVIDKSIFDEYTDTITSFIDNYTDQFNKFKDDVQDLIDGIEIDEIDLDGIKKELKVYVDKSIQPFTDSLETINSKFEQQFTAVNKKITSLENRLNDLNISGVLAANIKIIELDINIDGNEDIVNFNSSNIILKQAFDSLVNAADTTKVILFKFDRYYDSNLMDTVIVTVNNLTNDGVTAYTTIIYNNKLYNIDFDSSGSTTIEKININVDNVIPPTKNFVIVEK